VQLEGDSPLVEEFELSLWLAAGRSFWRGTALATTAQFAAASFASSPNLWWCSILLGVLFTCVVCVVVVYASAHYVRMLLLLI
jgi:hypothetical protein